MLTNNLVFQQENQTNSEGMRFRGNHKFSKRDTIKLEKDNKNKEDPNAIKIIVNNKHVAYVGREYCELLRNQKKLDDFNINFVKNYTNSVVLSFNNSTKLSN